MYGVLADVGKSNSDDLRGVWGRFWPGALKGLIVSGNDLKEEVQPKGSKSRGEMLKENRHHYRRLTEVSNRASKREARCCAVVYCSAGERERARGSVFIG